MLVSLIGLYSVLSPDTRSTLSDIVLVGALIVGSATALTLMLKFWGGYIWTPFRWFWRRMWGRDERGEWATPVPKIESWLNRVMQPAITKNTETVLAEVVRASQDARLELGMFRRENAVQHGQVEARLDALEQSNVNLTDSHHALSERLVAVETALKLRTE